jgi:hypothetical protein
VCCIMTLCAAAGAARCRGAWRRLLESGEPRPCGVMRAVDWALMGRVAWDQSRERADIFQEPYRFLQGPST